MSSGQQTDSSKRHTEGLLVKEFCTQRKSKCDPCGNKYDDCVKNGPAVAAFKFPRAINKSGGIEVQDISQNAHHILCIAEVTKVISKDDDLRRVLANTKYCVNASVNMIALPLFSHTVHWYCTYDDSGDKQTIGSMVTTLTPPPFVNLPNHCFDHGRYNKEVETTLGKLKAYVKEAVHKFETNELASALDNISNGFRGKLVKRGLREGGTHTAWMAALNRRNDNWYKPFSLAKNPRERAFPRRSKRTMDRLVKALLNR